MASTRFNWSMHTRIWGFTNHLCFLFCLECSAWTAEERDAATDLQPNQSRKHIQPLPLTFFIEPLLNLLFQTRPDSKCPRERCWTSTTPRTSIHRRFQKWRETEMPLSSSEWWPLVICAVLPVGNISTRYKSLQRNHLSVTIFPQGKKIQRAKRRCGRHGLSWAPNIQVNRSLPHVSLLMIILSSSFPRVSLLLIILGST